MLPPHVVNNYATRQFSTELDVRAPGTHYGEINLESDIERNRAISEETIKEVRQYLTIGTNAAKDSCTGYSPDDRKALAEEIRFIINDSAERYMESNEGGIEFDVFAGFCLQAIETYGYAHCGELACAAMMALKNNDIYPLVYCETSIGEHALVIIGIKEGADLSDMTTWGESAVICDAWAEKTYPLSQFEEMQHPENEVRYADFWYESDSASNPTPHYLAGDLIAKYHYTLHDGFVRLNQKS